MKELLDLLEDSEEREPEVMDIPKRGEFPPPAVAGEKNDPDLLQGSRRGITSFQAEQSGEEAFLAQDMETARKGERPGNIAALILKTVEESIGQEGRLSVMPDMGVNVWAARSGEVAAGAEEKPAPLPEWAAERREDAEKRWYEAVREHTSGTERLYLGINAPQLRGTESGERNVVVQLNEPEQGAPGAAAMDIRTLDRVFQRDARRYDGGLSPL